MFFQIIRGVSRAAATFKMESFVIIINGFQPLTIATKRSILGVAAVLDPPMIIFLSNQIILPIFTKFYFAKAFVFVI